MKLNTESRWQFQWANAYHDKNSDTHKKNIHITDKNLLT